MSKTTAPRSVVFAAVLAALPAIVLPLWVLLGFLFSSNDAHDGAVAADGSGTVAWVLIFLGAIVFLCVWIARGFLKGSSTALRVARICSWSLLVVALFVTVKNLADGAVDPGFLMVAAPLAATSIAMLVAISRARKTTHFA